MTIDYHLAQTNVARMRAPLDDPIMAGFVERLEPLNELADASPGFVWRLQSDDGDATAIRVFEDELILFNLSVWESIDALQSYVYRSHHIDALQKRNDWFEPYAKASFALWWIPAGHEPGVEEAKSRLDILWSRGPTADAFTFRRSFPQPPGAGRSDE